MKIKTVLGMVLVLPALAFADSTGVAGYSTSGCASCHTGSNTPTRPAVTLSGPSSVSAGSSNTYSLTITGGPGVTAGLDVSVSGGTLQPAGASEKLSGTDLTHTSPQAMTGQSYTFSFMVVAGSGSSMTLSATGLSSNGDGTEAGDKDNQASLSIAIGGSSGGAPTVATPAAASPATVTSASTQVSVLGSLGGGGDTGLVYTWSATSTGTGTASFAPNSSNAAKDSTATFTAAGTYTLTATIANGGNTVTSSATAVVLQTLTGLRVGPVSPTVLPGSTQTFSATGMDQFGRAMSAPAVTWTASGDGTITASGVFTAGSQTGTATVTDTAGSLTGSTSVTISTSGSGSSPQVSFIAPTLGESVAGQFQMDAAATGASGIASVTFGVDGEDFAVATQTPYTLTFDSTVGTNGNHVLSARAVDNAGNAAEATVNVTFNNSPAARMGCSVGGGAATWVALLVFAASALRRRAQRFTSEVV
jgi:hypothetical protein